MLPYITQAVWLPSPSPLLSVNFWKWPVPSYRLLLRGMASFTIKPPLCYSLRNLAMTFHQDLLKPTSQMSLHFSMNVLHHSNSTCKEKSYLLPTSHSNTGIEPPGALWFWYSPLPVPKYFKHLTRPSYPPTCHRRLHNWKKRKWSEPEIK